MEKRKIKLFFLIFALPLIFSFLISGCAGTNVGTTAAETTMAEMITSTTSADTAAPVENQVICKNNRFVPETLTVKTGTTVTWINQDGVVHTATSGNSPEDRSGLFDSGNIKAGGQFSFKFDKAGTYPYFCIPHFKLGMIGKIIVTD